MSMTNFIFVLCASHALALRMNQGTPVTIDEDFYSGKVLSEDESRARMRSSSVVFMLPLGPGRSENGPYFRANIEQIGKLFREFAVVVGTPAGGDGEKATMQWKEEAKLGKCGERKILCNPDLKYEVSVTTKESSMTVPFSTKKKPCRAGRGRDAILDEIFGQGKKYDFAIAIDSDVSKQFNPQSFVKAFTLDGPWAMIAGNGIDSSNGSHQDWLPWHSKNGRPYGTTQKDTFGFDSNGAAFEVKGAFGGVAIYRTEALQGSGCKYSCAGPCEHNCLEDCLSAKGEKLLFHPGLVVEWKRKGGKISDILATWECGDKVCAPHTPPVAQQVKK